MEEFKKVMEVNLFGVIRCTQAVFHLIHQNADLTRLANANGQNWLKPKVITISSVASELAIPGAGAYSASKHACKGFINSFRAEVSAFGIDVVEVRPFFVATNIVPMNDGTIGPKLLKSLADKWGDSDARGNETDPFGRESPLNRYVGGAEAIVSRQVEGIKNSLPDRKTMMTPDYIAGKMEDQMRSADPRTHIVLTEKIGDKLFYNAATLFPNFIFGLLASLNAKTMMPYVQPVPVAKEKVAVEERAEKTLVAA
jgi:NAD(P)-dependent dehydrogenase (short-subunit alcohol dehydrogenase family)